MDLNSIPRIKYSTYVLSHCCLKPKVITTNTLSPLKRIIPNRNINLRDLDINRIFLLIQPSPALKIFERPERSLGR